MNRHLYINILWRKRELLLISIGCIKNIHHNQRVKESRKVQRSRERKRKKRNRAKEGEREREREREREICK